MGFNLGKELNKLKEFAFDNAHYAALALPFTPWGAGLGTLMQTKAPWLMNSKFMNSILGASIKDAGMSYVMAKAQNKKNPHLIAKNALMRNMFVNANKVGWDWNMMMGGDKTTLPALADRVVDPVDAVMARHDTTFTPNIDYAMPHPSAAYEMVPGAGPGGPYFAPSPYDVTTGYGEIVPEQLFPRYTGGINEEALKDQIAQIKAPTMYEKIPASEGFTIAGKDIQGPLDKLAMADVKNPLEGMGFLTTTKTKPSWMDKLLKRSEEAKELGITAGTDAYDEFYGIGETRPDMWKMLGLGYDWFADPLTEHDIQEAEDEKHRRRMEKMMWPRSMDDVYNFQDAFLGNKGGIASYRRGGTKSPEKPGGSMDAFLDWWLNREGLGGLRFSPTGGNTPSTDMYEFEDRFLGLNKGGIASLSNGGMGPGPYSNPYPDDDPNVDVQDIIQGPGFESIDELGALFGDPDEMASAPHPMEGWYDMFFDTFGRYPNNEAELIEFINESDVDVPAVAQGGRIGMYGGGKYYSKSDYLQEMMEKGPFDETTYLKGKIMEHYARTGEFPDWAINHHLDPEDLVRKDDMANVEMMGGGGELNAIPGGVVSGPGTETSDSIPAQLSNNEFVVTADAVRAAGGGDIDLGAQKFYGIMNALDPNSAKPGEPPVYS